jgi:hypothetical protein
MLAQNLQFYAAKEQTQSVNKWHKKDEENKPTENELARRRREERERMAQDEEIERLKKEQFAMQTKN